MSDGWGALAWGLLAGLATVVCAALLYALVASVVSARKRRQAKAREDDGILHAAVHNYQRKQEH